MQNDGSFLTAIHICVYLSLNHRLCSSKQIAESIGTNPVLVRRLIGKLKDHGLVKVYRGKFGGCELARPGNDISLWEVFLAVRVSTYFKVRVRNAEDHISANLPEILEPVLAKAEYAMKQPLSNTSIAKVADGTRSV